MLNQLQLLDLPRDDVGLVVNELINQAHQLTEQHKYKAANQLLWRALSEATRTTVRDALNAEVSRLSAEVDSLMKQRSALTSAVKRLEKAA